MLRVLLPLIAVVSLTAISPAEELIVPAGTLLQCTLDEPGLSSKTTQVGDPIVCHVGTLRVFGRSPFLRGAYLAGRLQDYRDPGHFFGKGWIRLEFDRLVLPGEVVPVPAKVISVPRFRVDREGGIHGRGHPRRDALGWALPVLWPVKVITLPMRGPRPTLKGELRISLRLLDDVEIPVPAAGSGAVLRRGELSAPAFGTSGGTLLPKVWHGGASIPGETPKGLPVSDFLATVKQADSAQLDHDMERTRPEQFTLLILRDGSAYVVRDYWLEGGGRLVYVATDGTTKIISMGRVDLAMTIALNRERGMKFVLRSEPANP